MFHALHYQLHHPWQVYPHPYPPMPCLPPVLPPPTHTHTPIPPPPGDGPGQHPTQALLDLYSIKKEIGRLTVRRGLMGGRKGR